MKPAALSSRRVEAKARVWASAARLTANAPCIPLLPAEVSPPTRSIGPSWPDFDVWLGVKNVSRSGSARAQSSEAHSRPANKRRHGATQWALSFRLHRKDCNALRASDVCFRRELARTIERLFSAGFCALTGPARGAPPTHAGTRGGLAADAKRTLWGAW